MVRHGVWLLGVLVLTQLMVPWLGMGWGWEITCLLWVGALVAFRFPQYLMTIGVVCGMTIATLWNPVLVPYKFLVLAALYAVRRHTPSYFIVLVVSAMVVPKMLFRWFYHQPYMHSWLDQAIFGHLLVVSTLYWRDRKDGRIGDPSFRSWVGLFFFAVNPINPLNFGPKELWTKPRADHRKLAWAVAQVGIKAGLYQVMGQEGARWLLTNNSPEALLSMSPGMLWGVLFFTYIRWNLFLSGTADVGVLLMRAFGLQLDMPFRWALLAWNPVELWRRWSIYNRKFLLKVVYFPLGGGKRRKYLNIMLTFWASALVLHSGFFGSRFWAVGAAGWRDQSLYFLGQGIAVCACLVFRARHQALDRASDRHPASDRFWGPPSRELRWDIRRLPGMVATQGFSAWIHVIVLAGALSLQDRFAVMAHAFGFSVGR